MRKKHRVHPTQHRGASRVGRQVAAHTTPRLGIRRKHLRATETHTAYADDSPLAGDFIEASATPSMLMTLDLLVMLSRGRLPRACLQRYVYSSTKETTS